MIRRIAFIVLIFCLINIFKTIAQPVSQDSLKIIAKNFYLEKANSFFSIKSNEIKITSIETTNSIDNIPLYSIINFEPKGFVIISAQRNVFPILGYSFENNYSKTEENPNFIFWMNNYKKQIYNAFINNYSTNKKIYDAWNYYKKPHNNITKEKALAPLLTSTWNQDKYYNELCPADAAGPGGHTYAGCVATAMGQIMFYHRWPHSGFGSYSYTHPDYGVISENFGNSTYDWDAMANNITTSNLAIAKLLYHIGVSVDMNYGPGGSGMWNHHAAISYKNYFKYCSQTRYIFRDSTSLPWDSIIIANLDQKKPLYYAGWEDTTYTAGHAFVCDGYQSNIFFHFNWGWGGSQDGFFYLDQLNPSGYNFNLCQELVADIYPDTINYTYPAYCSGYKEITGSNGTFTDGSSTKPYSNNSNCSWLLNPDCGIKLKLGFNNFDLAIGDTINIYDGTNSQANLLASYNNTDVPVTSGNVNPTIIESSSKNLFVTFKSDDNTISDGFLANYSVKYCQTDTVTNQNGSVSDGSGACDYASSSNCRWVIKPANAQSITLNFTEFNLATNNIGDFVQIYKNSFSGSNSIAIFNYLNPPTGPLTIQAPIVCIKFFTNTDITASGWTIDYLSSTTGIPENTLPSSGMIVFPNPFKENAVIRFSSSKTKNALICISDLSGKIILKKSVSTSLEVTEILISELASNIMPGCYVIKIETDSKSFVNKIIRLPEELTE
ncbi:MAG: C10 family peptidase [Bacteroidia bacterium]|nr:C10 family peptidase [Bacteroidia bacterium]